MGVNSRIVLVFFLLGSLGCSGQMGSQPSFRSQQQPFWPATGSIPQDPARPWSDPIPPATVSAIASLRLTQSVQADGKALYLSYCAFCHGAEGLGNGPVGEVYLPTPANLSLPRIRALRDVELYERITNGFSTMPAFRARLSPEERWQIIAYVRSLQR